ncbi:MAG: hypothetical protein ACYDH9_19165 [Limisphaerales bacterium]
MNAEPISTRALNGAHTVRAFYESPAEPGGLSREEEQGLSRCEAVIRTGWESFVEVGAALAHIRDQRLYRQHHKTFEAYCRRKWAYGRQYAYRLIGAAEVVKHLSPIGDIQKPTHESQVRPLIGLKPEQVREAWKKAATKANGEVIRATTVKEAASEYRPDGVQPKTQKIPPQSRTTSVTTALRWLAKTEEVLRAVDGAKDALRFLSKARALLMKLKK